MRHSKAVIILIASFLFFGQLAYAHQPRLGGEGITYIENPEVSQAFYSTLEGKEEEVYIISSDREFKLLVNILVPDVPNIVTESLGFVVENDKEEVLFESSTDLVWEPLFEPFARDDYFEGALFEEQTPAGTYTITVSGNDKVHKYVLVTGKKEIFPFDEIINTIKVLPELKTDFFEKPLYTAYLNPVGGFLLFVIVLVILLSLLLRRIFMRVKRKI